MGIFAVSNFEDKAESLIEKLKREVQYKKSLAIRKAKIENKDGVVSKRNIVVLKIADPLFNKIQEDSEALDVSNQKVIENILMKHYKLLRRK